MPDWPTVCILLLTYDRAEYAVKTLHSALWNLQYSGQLVVHVADDGSPDGYVDQFLAEAIPATWVDSAIGINPTISHTNAERGGYGRNFNLALQQVHAAADVVLVLEDDWELTRPFDLDPMVQALQEEKFDCIRLGYIGFTQDLQGKFIHAASQTYLLLDPDSEEPHVWAGHPRLETRVRQRRVGPWPESLPDESDSIPDPGTTEFMVAQRAESRKGVVWPVGAVLAHGDLFVHVGTVQARTDQKEKIAT